MKIFIIADKKTNVVTEIFQSVNLSFVVRDIKALVDQDLMKCELVRPRRYEESYLYELDGDITNGYKVAQKFDLADVTQLHVKSDQKKDVNIKHQDILEDSVHGKN